MRLSEKRRYFTCLVGYLLVWATTGGYEIALDTARRSLEEQRRLVEEGHSRTLKSKHVEGLAVDLLLYRGTRYVIDPEAYRPLGEYWCSLDAQNVWGGNWVSFRDYGHFEYGG